MELQTNYALVAYTPTEDPMKGNVIHTCFYENPPTQRDVNALIEELATDTEFGMIGLVCDQDYFLNEITGETLRILKEDMKIPDVLTQENSSESDLNVRTE